MRLPARLFARLPAAILLGMLATVAHAEGSRPVRFAPVEGSSEPVMPIRHVHTMESHLSDDGYPWPFTTDTIVLACADRDLSVVKVGDRYAALNGLTSELSKQYVIEEASGRRAPIIGTRSHKSYVEAGMVLPTADPAVVRAWLFSEFLPFMEFACNPVTR